MLRLVLAALHLLALGIGMGAVWARARALRGTPTAESLRRAFVADAWWGIAAGLWVITGLWRFLGSLEKGTDYYLDNHIFLTKMGLFLLILALEMLPMITLIRWRRAAARGALVPETVSSRARQISVISYAELVIVITMVFAAVSIARGFGA